MTYCRNSRSKVRDVEMSAFSECFLFCFYTSTKSWRGYIFTAVCLCVCVACYSCKQNSINHFRTWWRDRVYTYFDPPKKNTIKSQSLNNNIKWKGSNCVLFLRKVVVWVEYHNRIHRWSCFFLKDECSSHGAFVTEVKSIEENDFLVLWMTRK